jgi:hypothetical protein
MKEKMISPKSDPKAEAEIILFMYGFLRGLEDGMLVGLTRHIRELQKRGLIPEEKTGEAIQAVLDDYGFGDLAYSEIAQKTAEFYQNVRNRGIELFYSVPLIVRRLKGRIDDTQMESELKEFRFRFPAQGESEQ